jgi:tetratricopeptide (TPR) repeat protein
VSTGSYADELGRIGALIDLGRYEQADQRLRSLLANNPDSAQGWIWLASVSRQLHRASESVAAAQRAVAIAPESASSHIALSEALVAVRRRREAVSAAREAVRLAPNSAATHYTLANVLRRGGHRSRREALDAAQRTLALNPHDADCHNLVGLCLEGVGRKYEASASFNEGLRIDPHHAHLLNNLGALRIGQNDPTGAGRAIVAGLNVDAHHEHLQRNLGVILVQVALKVATSSYITALGIGFVAIGHGAYWIRALFGAAYLVAEAVFIRRALTPIPQETRARVVRMSIQRHRRVRVVLGGASLMVVITLTIAFAPSEVSRTLATVPIALMVPLAIVGLGYWPIRAIAQVVDRLRR